jgi:hypothetical protein
MYANHHQKAGTAGRDREPCQDHQVTGHTEVVRTSAMRRRSERGDQRNGEEDEHHGVDPDVEPHAEPGGERESRSPIMAAAWAGSDQSASGCVSVSPRPRRSGAIAVRRRELRDQPPPHKRGKRAAVKKKHRRAAALVMVGNAHIADLREALCAVECGTVTNCGGAHHLPPALDARRRRGDSPASSSRQKPRSRMPATHVSAMR